MRVTNSISLIVLCIVSINYVFAQSSCVTPNGENGNCILFTNCEPFTRIWENRTSKNIAFFRNSHCGFLDRKPLVCCGSVAEYVDNLSSTEKQSTKATTSTTSPPISNTLRQLLFTSAISTNTPTSPSTILFTSSSVLTTSSPNVLFTSSTVSTTSSPPVVFTSNPTVPTTKPPGVQNHPNFGLLPPPGKCGLHSAGERISNGNETDLDEYPWMAMLLYRNEQMEIVPNCGGSLINNKYVMTAAHCIKGNLFSVRLGEYNLNTDIDCIFEEDEDVCADPPQEFGIEDWTIFRRYTNRNINRHHDIALIRLKGEVNITDFVKPICLPLNNERSDPGEVLSVAGWGLTEKNFTSPIKLTVDLPMWSDTSCRELYSIGYGINISSRQFCAGGGAQGKDSCAGDSGGPLMRTFPNRTEYYAEGVVSFGPDPCGRQATPGVYVRVSEYVTWILDTMKK